jgi:hypothetical protein
VCDSFYSFIIPPKKPTIKRVFRIWGGFSGIFAGRKENPAVEGFKFGFIGLFSGGVLPLLGQGSKGDAVPLG